MAKVVRFIAKNKTEFDQMQTKDTNAIYFVFDNTGSEDAVNQIYKGDILYGGGVFPTYLPGEHITFDTVGNTITINADCVGEWLQEGSTYTYSGVTYTVGKKVERFNCYEDDVVLGVTANEAAGNFSHVEGASNRAYSDFSHAEGFNSISDGSNAHAEGSSYAHGISAHSEGYSNRDVSTPANTTGALGNYSHAEGYNCKAVGNYSHAEGYQTTAVGMYTHAEGMSNTAVGDYSHAEGYYNTAVGRYSHAEGDSNTAQGEYSHAEGYGNNIASAAYEAHVEGRGNVVTASDAHCEGYESYANGIASHCEGYENHANGIRSHCEGYLSEANGDASHAEGTHCIASAQNSHAGGNYSTASGVNAFAHGSRCTASGVEAFALGNECKANGDNSFAIGSNTIANGANQLVIGYYNVPIPSTSGSSEYPFIIGNGGNNNRSNAFKVDNTGKIYVGDNDGVDVSGLNVTSSDHNKVLTASYQNGVGTYSWQDAPESGVCVVHTYTDTALPVKVVLDDNNEYRYINLANANSLTISIETIDTTKSFYSTIVLHNVSSTNSLSTFVTVSSDSVISNIIFLNEDNVDLSTSDTAELLFFTNGLSNTVMCIAYAYGTTTP